MSREVNACLDEIQPPKRWCESPICACLGCVNRHSYWPDKIKHRLGRMVTKSEFENWREEEMKRLMDLPDSTVRIEHLSYEEVMNKYGDILTGKQVKEIKRWLNEKK